MRRLFISAISLFLFSQIVYADGTPGDFAPNRASKIKVSNFETLFNHSASPQTVQSSLEAIAASYPIVTPFTAGSVIFHNGSSLAQDNDNFFWDESLIRLGIGTATPEEKLQISADDTMTKIILGDGNPISERQLVLSSPDNSNLFARINLAGTTSSLRLGTRDFANLLTMANTGRVGVNKTSPSVTLDVLGDVLFQSSTDSTTAVQIKNAAGDVIFDVDTSGDKVGIGTDSPDRTFDVESSDIAIAEFQGSNVTGAYLDIAATGADGDAGIRFLNVTASEWVMGFDDGDEDKFKIAHTNLLSAGTLQYFTIKENGNIGINTTAPIANLQVAQSTAGFGTISVGAGGTAVTGIATQFTNTFKVGDTITSETQTKTIATITDDTHLTTDAWGDAISAKAYTLVGGDRFSVLGNGNVGIGTTTPQQELHTVGDGIFEDANPHLLFWDSGTNIGYFLHAGDTTETSGYGEFGIWRATGTVSAPTIGDIPPHMYFKANGDVIFPYNEGVGTGTPDTKLQVVGISRFGEDTTNYSEFESDGTLEFNGTATVFRDVNFAIATLTKGAAAPSLIDFAGSNIEVLGFNGAATPEEVSGVVELDHYYKEGSDISPHIHWTPVNTDGGNVKWQLEYTWFNPEATFDAGQTITATAAAGSVAWDERRTDFPVIDGTGMLIESQFAFRLFRDPTDGDDTYGSDAAGLTFGFHVEMDTIGSRDILVK